MEEKFKDFEQNLRFHDWYYDYSDDNNVYRKGLNSERRINAQYLELMQVDEKRAIETWNKYAPPSYQKELHLF